jgi:DNA-binding transcriptional MerR regulator
MAVACGFLVWWLLKWLTGSLGTQIKEIKQEIKDETDEVQGEVRQLHSITISLIDRIRVLERNTLLAHTTMLGQLGCKELPVWHETRKEKIAELKEQIKDIGRNGEIG